jgi:D-tyrosyl-tRNA(Tyr) deacylase
MPVHPSDAITGGSDCSGRTRHRKPFHQTRQIPAAQLQDQQQQAAEKKQQAVFLGLASSSGSTPTITAPITGREMDRRRQSSPAQIDCNVPKPCGVKAVLLAH